MVSHKATLNGMTRSGEGYPKDTATIILCVRIVISRISLNLLQKSITSSLSLRLLSVGWTSGILSASATDATKKGIANFDKDRQRQVKNFFESWPLLRVFSLVIYPTPSLVGGQTPPLGGVPPPQGGIPPLMGGFGYTTHSVEGCGLTL